MKKDLYEILGLDRNNFSEKALKKNYKKLALKYHPDRQTNKSEQEKKEAEEKFKEISHAYDVLSDPEKRNNYDMFGDESGMSENSRGFNPFSAFNGFNPFGGGFDDFNPFSSGRQRRNSIHPGENIKMTIPISIEDLFNGVKKTVKYKKKVRCISCHGKGGTGEKQCPTCHGTGKIVNKTSRGSWMSIEETICPNCHGSGMFVEHKCHHCNGTGFEIKETTLEIEMPAGIPDNVYIEYPEKGSESKDHRGQTGSFLALTRYNIDEEKYIIDGLNVIEHVYIPYYDILLGCTYEVNIPNGVKKKVKISSCTPENKLIKLSHEGIKGNNGNTGDYFICIHYDIPDSIGSKEKEHLEIIRNLNK